MKYRKKPVVIEAMQFDGSNHSKIYAWSNFEVRSAKPHKDNYYCLAVETLEGTMEGNIGDFVIRGIKGEYYFCKPDIFELTYEKVEE
jgi:hypothetical protein